jgi:hypothetical protein
MTRKMLLTIILTMSILLLVFAAVLFTTGRLSRNDIQHYVPWSIAKFLYPADDVFVDYDFPLKESHWIYDAGIVDANGDGWLDIFTTNHNWRQQLLLADGQGGYRESLSAWGLDQSHEFPGVEISTVAPEIKKPGVYIYWLNRHLYVRTNRLEDYDPVIITLHAITEIEILSNSGFQIDSKKCKAIHPPLVTECTFIFSASGNTLLEMYPRSRGVPMDFKLDDSIPAAHIYVGNQLISPRSQEFSLPLQDRHAMAWSDFNDDGQLDIFISRGAIGGSLRIFPESIVSNVKEEFYVSRDGRVSDNPQFDNIILEAAIVKNGCSARHASWVDFNQDGLLDIFINCEDVGNVEGKYPNKLYQQTRKQEFEEVAEQAGLQILDNNIIDYEWFDADNDGDMDLFTNQDNGFYLYRNNSGHFKPQFIDRGKFSRIDNPTIKGASGAYWIFDGKLSVADYDRDGDLDVFSASKKGNTLLLNEAGSYVKLDPESVGLPADSVSASWVDYDNDGLTDLHTVPAGIYKQREDHKFNKTNLLAQPSDTYMASIINWFDINNDGLRDVLIALNENQTLHRWWEPSLKDIFLWEFQTYLNTESENHWLQLKLVGAPGNREAIGARVTVETTDGQQIQEVGYNDGAFYSQGHYRLYFGLGKHSKADVVTIRWPDGKIQNLKNITGDSILVVEHNKQPAGN